MADFLCKALLLYQRTVQRCPDLDCNLKVQDSQPLLHGILDKYNQSFLSCTSDDDIKWFCFNILVVFYYFEYVHIFAYIMLFGLLCCGQVTSHRSLLCFLAGVHCHGHGIGLGLGHGMVGAMPMPMPSLSPCHDDAMAMAWPSTLGVFLRGPIVE